MLSGVGDIHILWGIFGLTFVTMIFGLMFERENAYRRLNGQNIRWLAFWLGFIPHMFAWATVLCYFFRAMTVGDPPAFVWAIIIIEFFLDLTFAVNLFLQWCKFSDYLKVRMMQCVHTAYALVSVCVAGVFRQCCQHL